MANFIHDIYISFNEFKRHIDHYLPHIHSIYTFNIVHTSKAYCISNIKNQAVEFLFS